MDNSRGSLNKYKIKILGQTKWLSENNCLVNVQSDGESETEEEGGKGETKELTLFQIMERRYIHKCQKLIKMKKMFSNISRVSCFLLIQASINNCDWYFERRRGLPGNHVLHIVDLFSYFNISLAIMFSFLAYNFHDLILYFVQQYELNQAALVMCKMHNVSGSKRFTAVETFRNLTKRFITLCDSAF